MTFISCVFVNNLFGHRDGPADKFFIERRKKRPFKKSTVPVLYTHRNPFLHRTVPIKAGDIGNLSGTVQEIKNDLLMNITGKA